MLSAIIPRLRPITAAARAGQPRGNGATRNSDRIWLRHEKRGSVEKAFDMGGEFKRLGTSDEERAGPGRGCLPGLAFSRWSAASGAVVRDVHPRRRKLLP